MMQLRGAGISSTSSSIVTKQTLEVLTTIAQSTLSESSPGEYVDVLQITRSGAVTDKAVKVLLQIINGGIQNGLIDAKILDGVSKNTTTSRTARRLLGGGVSFFGSEEDTLMMVNGSNNNNNSSNNINNNHNTASNSSTDDNNNTAKQPSWNPFFAPKGVDPSKEKLALSLGNQNNNSSVVVTVRGLTIFEEDGSRIIGKALPSNSSNREKKETSQNNFGGNEGRLSHYNNSSKKNKKKKKNKDDDDNENDEDDDDEEEESVNHKTSQVVISTNENQEKEESYRMKVDFILEDETERGKNGKSKSKNQNNNNKQKANLSLDEQSDPIPKRLGRKIDKTQIKNPKALLALLLRERLRDRLFDSASYSLGNAKKTKAKSVFLNDPLLQGLSSSSSSSPQNIDFAASLSQSQVEAIERRIDCLKMEEILLLLKNIESEEQAILLMDSSSEHGEGKEQELFDRDRSFYEEVAAAMKAADIKNLPKRKSVGVQAAIGPAVLIERETVVVNFNDLSPQDEDDNEHHNNTNNTHSRSPPTRVFHHQNHDHHQYRQNNNNNNRSFFPSTNNNAAATFSISSGHVEPLSAALGKKGRQLQEYLKHSGGVQVVRKDPNNQQQQTRNNNNHHQESSNEHSVVNSKNTNSKSRQENNHEYLTEEDEAEEENNNNDAGEDENEGDFNLDRYRNSLSKSLKLFDEFSKKFLHTPADRLHKDIFAEISKLKSSFFKTLFGIVTPAENWFQYSDAEAKKFYTESAWEQGLSAVKKFIKVDAVSRKELNKKLWRLGLDCWRIEKTASEAKSAGLSLEVKHASIQLALALTARSNLIRESIRDLWIQRIQSMSGCIRILLRVIRGKRKIDARFGHSSGTAKKSPKQQQQQQASENNSSSSLSAFSNFEQHHQRIQSKETTGSHSRASTRTYRSTTSQGTTANSDRTNSFLLLNERKGTLRKTSSITTTATTATTNDDSQIDHDENNHNNHIDATRSETRNNRIIRGEEVEEQKQKQQQQQQNEFSPRTFNLPKLPFALPSAEGDGNSANSNPMFASALATARALDRLKLHQEQLNGGGGIISSATPNPSRQAQLHQQFQRQNQQQQQKQEKKSILNQNALLNYVPFQFSPSPKNVLVAPNLSASSPQPPKTSRQEMAEWITNINKAVTSHKKVDDGSKNVKSLTARR
jgi:hypothetical protein